MVDTYTPNDVSEKKETNHDEPLKVVVLESGEIITMDGQSILTKDDIAKRFGISLKTVCRWMAEGILDMKNLEANECDTTKKGITEEQLHEFTNKYRTEIKKVTEFSRMSDSKKRQLNEEIKIRLLRGDVHSQIIKALVMQFNRTIGNIRTSINRIEESDDKVIKYREENKTGKEKEVLDKFLNGHDVIEISVELDIPFDKVREIINTEIDKSIIDLDLECIGNCEFPNIKAGSRRERKVTASILELEEFKKAPPQSGDAGAYIANLFSFPLLNKEQEVQLFRKLNYLKYKANALRESIGTTKSLTKKRSMYIKLMKLNRKIEETRNILISTNLRLVVNIA
ncbi:MAG: hypothetical protein KAS32_21875, partial [Candidatus Peribacteraceae bacterium]|nr:hypothetical protein [Candidatus Peribacteraceae bacterium]